LADASFVRETQLRFFTIPVSFRFGKYFFLQFVQCAPRTIHSAANPAQAWPDKTESHDKAGMRVEILFWGGLAGRSGTRWRPSACLGMEDEKARPSPAGKRAFTHRSKFRNL